MVGLGGKAPTAASSNCLATVLGCDNREKTDEGGVGQGVNVVGGKPAGDGESGEFDILLVKWNKKHV
jgi:hypothetical protein